MILISAPTRKASQELSRKDGIYFEVATQVKINIDKTPVKQLFEAVVRANEEWKHRGAKWCKPF